MTVSFKKGQKVRIKGTGITGELYAEPYDGVANVEVLSDGGRVEKDYYVPEALVEAVTEPITVTFDPVELPVTLSRPFRGNVEVREDNSPAHISLAMTTLPLDYGECLRSLTRDEARQIGRALLTFAEAENA